MTGVSHARIGAAVGAVVGHLAGVESGFVRELPAFLPGPARGVVAAVSVAAVTGAAGAVLAWLPDADTESTLGAILPRAWHWLTPGHRKLSHSLLALAAWWAFAVYVTAGFAIPEPAAGLARGLIVAAVASHLLADALTDHGIRPLYPLSSWHLRVVGFRTGSWPEPWFVAAALVLAVVLLVDPLHVAAVRGGGA